MKIYWILQNYQVTESGTWCTNCHSLTRDLLHMLPQRKEMGIDFKKKIKSTGRTWLGPGLESGDFDDLQVGTFSVSQIHELKSSHLCCRETGLTQTCLELHPLETPFIAAWIDVHVLKATALYLQKKQTRRLLVGEWQLSLKNPTHSMVMSRPSHIKKDYI